VAVNKQEALEMLLVTCRRWEHEVEETRRVDPGLVYEDLVDSARAIEIVLASSDADELKDRKVEELLGRIGGAVLYLLVDEVTVVERVGVPLTVAQVASGMKVVVMREGERGA
jgi:hypothetical protein